MVKDKHTMKRIIDRFKPRSEVERSDGIFTEKTKKQMLRIFRIPKGVSHAQFWYRRREGVKTALFDLELFLEMAGRKNVNRVLTKETLKPIIDALLFHPILDQEPPDRKRAEIANLLIEAGFDYLRKMSTRISTRRSIFPLEQRVIDDAIAVSNYLVEYFESEESEK